MDLPEPEGPMTATTSPGWIEKSAPSSAGVGPYARGQLQPAQIGLQVEQRVIADQLVGEVAGALALGQAAHQPQMLGALGVEQLGGVPAGQQGQDDLGVERGVEVRLGLLRPGQPLGDIGDAGVGDGVPLALRARAGLHAVHLDQAVLQQPGHRGVDLPVVQRAVLAEVLVEGPLEVVAMAGTGLQEAQQRMTD
ncbi:hypothetical protein ADL22_05735 [Streptomyces sp. NRRL F-4489]|nr:hypothetical protein ADL22_05735 [Streptomyces sp. NRRL F-4489]